MKRTPIIVPGQVYYHDQFKDGEYLVVTAARQGDITYRGPGFTGHSEVDVFLERFLPVDPEDLSAPEAEQLTELLNNSKISLSTGWVVMDGDNEEDEDE